MVKIVGILLPLPLNGVFDYKIDEDAPLGQLVRVSWGKEQQIGVVWKEGKSADIDDIKIKHISEKINLPPLSAEIRKFVEWVAAYNMAPLGLVLKMVIGGKNMFDNAPMDCLYRLTGKTLAEAKLKNSDARWQVMHLLEYAPYSRKEITQGAGVSQSVIKTLIDNKIIEPIFQEKKKDFGEPKTDFSIVKLTEEQQAAADVLCAKIENGFSVTLLDGVTGSGKTEVYFEAIAKALEFGRQVLVMVPEIVLTSQWLNRFERRFGVKPACWHSNLSMNEKSQTFKSIIRGEAKVIVGARSALFLPYFDLGLIVVDESHDHSFKQEDVVNYQGRDMAIVRANIEKIPTILSTATPDLETVINVEERKYDCVKLKSRFAAALLPEIKVIDLKKDKPQKGEWGVSWLAPSLVDALKENLEKNEQSMLFLNRRGYAPLIICRDCGHRIQCPHCTAWLTEHKSSNSLVCHQCGYSMPLPKTCPECGSETGLTACGPGVERIAEEIKHRFPNARIAIVSSDITSSFAEVSQIISQMENGELDIIIGTQILAKGHHFPMLTLVGVIDADLGLMSSDLRASEQTYQLLTQVAGRAGRGEKKGTVYLQTLYPENNVLKAILNHDSEEFTLIEKKNRKILNMPPFGKLAAVIVSGDNQNKTEKIAYMLGKTAPNTEHISTLGPAPAPLFMIRGKYRYRLLLKTDKNINIQDIIKKWLSMVEIPASVRIKVDINPYSFM